MGYPISSQMRGSLASVALPPQAEPAQEGRRRYPLVTWPGTLPPDRTCPDRTWTGGIPSLFCPRPTGQDLDDPPR